MVYETKIIDIIGHRKMNFV
nr:unnamed protein product [Callosobruchus chinensis]